jgi:hypothetical protein
MRITTLLLATVAPLGAAVGFLDVADCSALAGWAASTSPLTQVKVSVFVDGTLVSETQANKPRPDVRAALGSSLDHGFSMTLPSAALAAKPVQVSVKAGNRDLNGSPKTLTCAKPADPAKVPEGVGGPPVQFGQGLIVTGPVNGVRTLSVDFTVVVGREGLKGSCEKRDGAIALAPEGAAYMCLAGKWKKLVTE